MEQLEFNSFLLHLGNELESNEFEALKFVLKGSVTSSKCEEMVQVFKYFEEMERLCLLSPTNFLVLKIALGSIGRLDLVKKIEGKEEYFATLFRETITDDNCLDRKDCDMVCDDIKKAAVHLAGFFPRSGQSTSEMHKKLKLIGGEKDIDFQLQEIAEELQASAEDEQMTSATAEPSEIKENDLSDVTTPSTSSLHPVDIKATPFLQTSKVSKHKALGSDKFEENLLESKTEHKNPSRETVSDGNHLEDFNTSKTPDKMKTAVTTGATSLHATMLPSFSSVTKLDDDVVTDGDEEGNKGNMRAGFNQLDEETTMNSSKQVSESDSYGSKDQMFPVNPSLLLDSYEAPTADSPQLQLKSYKKKGYSVAISNGSLCECTSEKGVVMMENGTTFSIAITNSNDYAAEVDITFGGRYLGFWSVDAQQTNPLIIEGSAWEKGKLTFTSDSPECLPSSKSHPADDSVESSGKIELEFKPEAMPLFVQHVRSDKKHEALLTGFKEATVDDLKEEINRTLWERLGIVSCLMRNGIVLEEQNTVRSYSLKDGDIIQVLTNEEPMSVEPLGLDAFTIRVDPRHDSCKRVMNAIAEKMSVDINKLQRLQINGEDLKETDSLATMFLKSKKPVIKVVTDMIINIIVHLPSQEVKKISIAWFATVDELKKELQIPQTDAKLKLDNKEICGSGSKQLIDLGLKNGSEVTVVSAQQKETQAPATHRGVKLSPLRKPGTTRGFGGFGDFEFHAPVSSTRGFSSDSRASPDPLGECENSDDIPEPRNQVRVLIERKWPAHLCSSVNDAPMTFQQDDLPAGLREGTCVLRGEELFANQFTLDTLERKFSKDKLKAVTLNIQLCSRSTVEAYPQ